MIEIDSNTKTIDVIAMLKFLTRDVLHNEERVLLLLDASLKKIKLHQFNH